MLPSHARGSYGRGRPPDPPGNGRRVRDGRHRRHAGDAARQARLAPQVRERVRDGMGVPAVTLGLDFHDVMAANAVVGGADTGYFDALARVIPEFLPRDRLGAAAPEPLLPARVRRRHGRRLHASRSCNGCWSGAAPGARADHRTRVRVHAVQGDVRHRGREGAPKPAGGDAALDLLRAAAAVGVGGVLQRDYGCLPLPRHRARQHARGDGPRVHGGHHRLRGPRCGSPTTRSCSRATRRPWPRGATCSSASWRAGRTRPTATAATCTSPCATPIARRSCTTPTGRTACPRRCTTCSAACSG